MREAWPKRIGHWTAARWREHQPWLVGDVLVPLLITRALLVLIASLAGHLPTNPDYPIAEAAARGWQFTPIRLIDVWGRWDTGWYFDLIQNGYYAPGDIRTVESNLGFFPLYPGLVKLLTLLSPVQSAGATLLAGVLVSNAFLLGAMVFLNRLTWRVTGDAGAARRAVLYALLFPTGFFLSAFYTEAAFLCLALAAFYAAERKAWGWASLAGAALTLTRPLGVLVAVPVGLMYLREMGWDPRRVRLDAAWFLLMPASLLGFFYYQYTITGDFLATIHTREAWARAAALPWEVVLNPQPYIGYITGVEQALTAMFVGGALWALRRLPAPAYGLYALLLVLPPLFSGQLLSTARYYLVAFPVFMLAAQLGRRPAVDMAIMAAGGMLQAFYFYAWCQFFWVA